MKEIKENLIILEALIFPCDDLNYDLNMKLLAFAIPPTFLFELL